MLSRRKTDWQRGAASNGEKKETPAGRSSRGKRYSAAFKQECLQLLAAGMKVEAVARAKGVSAMSLNRWKKAAEGKASEAVSRSREGWPQAARETTSDSAEAKSRAPHDNIAGLSDAEAAEILKLKSDHPTMGPAQIRAQLKRFRGWRISIKAIARVLRANGFRTEHRGPREEEALMRFEAPRPNALWLMDALALRVHAQRLYLHLVLDDFSRFIVGQRLSEHITSEEAVATLKEALARHGKPERVLTDRSSQFLALREETAFRRFLESELIDHSVSRPYHPQTLGKIESVNRAIQKELIYLHEFGSVTEARAAIKAWVERFNFHRAHLGIDGLVPADRYFGLQRRVLGEVQARSRKRVATAQLDSPIGSPLEEMGEALEVLRLMLVDGQLQVRFCGLCAVLGKEQS